MQWHILLVSNLLHIHLSPELATCSYFKFLHIIMLFMYYTQWQVEQKKVISNHIYIHSWFFCSFSEAYPLPTSHGQLLTHRCVTRHSVSYIKELFGYIELSVDSVVTGYAAADRCGVKPFREERQLTNRHLRMPFFPKTETQNFSKTKSIQVSIKDAVFSLKKGFQNQKRPKISTY